MFLTINGGVIFEKKKIKGDFYISREDVKKNIDIVDMYKLLTSKITSEHAGEPDSNNQFKVLSRTEILLPGEVCTDSYLILFISSNKEIIENYYSYISSKFARFLLMQAVSSINLSIEKFMFVPIQDFSKHWTDEELYKKYKLSPEEIDFIESTIKPM